MGKRQNLSNDICVMCIKTYKIAKNGCNDEKMCVIIFLFQ